MSRTMTYVETLPIKVTKTIDDANFDSLVLLLEDINCLPDDLAILKTCLEANSSIYSKFSCGIHVLRCEELPSKRLIVCFSGPLNRDYDDTRRINESARDGIAQALKIGSTKPLLALGPLKTLPPSSDYAWTDPKYLCISTLMGALYSLYVPLETREFAQRPDNIEEKKIKEKKAQWLGWLGCSLYELDHDLIVRCAWCLEEGRRVSRDIGGSDPERMCPGNILAYMSWELPQSDELISWRFDPVDEAKYPLAAVVDRGSSQRHRGHIVHLEYANPADDAGVDDEKLVNLYLIGKGIVYDTGGSDLKTGGCMINMHRDKCGAAAVVGFFKTLSLLKPRGIKVYGSLALVRNSIGPDSYVSDEIIISRAGVRVRVNNTDAEGRMVLTDLICEAKEKASKTPNSHLISIATLTGHAGLAYGPNYTAVVCNGPAHKAMEDRSLQEAGSLLGEMIEISTLRREDYQAHAANEEYADLVNSARPVEGKRVRGHQSPAAFMVMASGLDSHLLDSENPLRYTHLDIASSSGPCPGIPSAVPLLALAARYIIPELL